VIITISGTPGSGKTTLGKMLARELGYEFISIGDIVGTIAKERGMDLHELQAHQETDKSIDVEIDEYQRKLGKEKDNFVIDSRLGFHFIPGSIKILVVADAKVGAQRIFNDPRHDEKKAIDLNEQMEFIERRMKSDKLRYKKFYNIDPNNPRLFDFVMDTSKQQKPQDGLVTLLAYLHKRHLLDT
jgi:CMP/dCMP kinase